MSDTNQDKILSKISKLLELAKSSNENEASLAAAKANELLLKYNLSISDIAEITVDDTEIIEDVAYENGRMCQWRIDLAEYVACANKCRLVIYSGIRSVTNTKLKFVGSKVDITVAKLVFNYLCEATERLTRINAYSKGKVYCNSYRQGVTVRLGMRLSEASKANETKAKENATSVGTALVLRKDQALTEYMEKFTGHKKRSETKLDFSGYNSGYKDGGNISLNKQINGGSNNSPYKQIG